MGKFKKIPNRYDVIDQNVAEIMAQGKNPGKFLEGELGRYTWYLKELEQKAKPGKPGSEWSETAAKNIKDQMRIIRAKLDDIQYGTRNFDLFRLEEQVEAITREIPRASLPREMILKGRLKRAKATIQQIRHDNNLIRRQNHLLGFDKPVVMKKSSPEETTGTAIHM